MVVRVEAVIAPPTSADVVVIGGGIVGCATAYYLSRNGISVALCEKGRVAGEQSSRNWGWVRQQGRDSKVGGRANLTGKTDMGRIADTLQDLLLVGVGRFYIVGQVTPVVLDRLGATDLRDIHEVQDAERCFTAFAS